MNIGPLQLVVVGFERTDRFKGEIMRELDELREGLSAAEQLLRSGGKLEAEAVNGTIDLSFSGGIAGRFEIDTLNGDIDNCFGPKPQRTSKYTPGWNLRFEEGDGDARVTASTVNGDISICR